VTTNPAEIADILLRLKVEHRELDQLIVQLSAAPGVDQLSLSRLKKRKLRLKDQITYWESKLIPDLDA